MSYPNNYITEIKTISSDDRSKTATIQILTEGKVDTLQVHCCKVMEGNRLERMICLASTLDQANHIAEDFVYGILRG